MVENDTITKPATEDTTEFTDQAKGFNQQDNNKVKGNAERPAKLHNRARGIR